MTRRRQILLDGCLLFLLFAAFLWPYFKHKYTDQWPSIESTFISDARFLVAHWPHPQWQPLWYTGTRFDYIYPPALRYGTAILSKIFGWWTVKAYHFYTLFFYCLGIAGVYFLVRVGGRSRAAGYLAALAAGLMSPSFLFMKNMRGDSGPFVPVRFGVLIRYGEGPHITALCLLPFALAFAWRALEARRYGSLALSAIFCAAVLSNNFYGATSLAIFFPLLLWSFWATRREPRRIAPALAIPLLAYGLTAFWLTPSYLRITLHNMQYVSQKGSVWSFALAGITVAIFAFASLRWGRQRRVSGTPAPPPAPSPSEPLPVEVSGMQMGKLGAWVGSIPPPAPPAPEPTVAAIPVMPVGEAPIPPLPTRPDRTWAIFVAGSVIFFALNVLGNYYLNFRVMGEPGRLVPELDLVLILGAMLFLEWLWRHRGPWPKLAVAVVAAVAFATTFGYIKQSQQIIRPWPDYRTRVEYRVTDWLWRNLPDARVCTSGTVRFWFDTWHDLNEVGGGSEQGLLNPVVPDTLWEIDEGTDPQYSLLWFKALGVDLMYVAHADSEEPYKDVTHPDRFSSWPVVWDDGQGNSLYSTQRLYAPRVRIVQTARLNAMKRPRTNEDLEYLAPYVETVEQGPPATLERQGTDAMLVRARLDAGQSLLVQETWDPAWRASADGQPLAVRKDPMGFMVVDPPPGDRTVRLEFVMPLENRVGWALTALALLALAGLAIRREG